MARSDYMQKPCAHCPFRSDVRPFLRAERGEELAYSTQNPYSEFFCHKTLGDDDEGETIVTDRSLICAGFAAMQANETGDIPYEEFEWPDNVYTDCWEMVSAYEENGE